MEHENVVAEQVAFISFLRLYFVFSFVV